MRWGKEEGGGSSFIGSDFIFTYVFKDTLVEDYQLMENIIIIPA